MNSSARCLLCEVLPPPFFEEKKRATSTWFYTRQCVLGTQQQVLTSQKVVPGLGFEGLKSAGLNSAASLCKSSPHARLLPSTCILLLARYQLIAPPQCICQTSCLLPTKCQSCPAFLKASRPQTGPRYALTAAQLLSCHSVSVSLALFSRCCQADSL